MGLVSKKRKIKSCDPFSKKFKDDDVLHADDIHEMPPPEREAKKTGTNHMLIKEVFNKRKAVLAERKKTEEKGKPKPNKLSGRFAGESIRNYRKRLRAETHQIIMEQSKSLTKTNVKRKQFLSDKKKGIKKMKLNNGESSFKDDEDVSDDNDNDRYDAPDDDKELHVYEKVAFGDIVERPPQLTSFPSKAEKKPRDWGSLAVSSLLTNGPTVAKVYNKLPDKSDTKASGDAAAKKRILETQRLAAVEAYRQLKARQTAAYGRKH